MKFRQLAAAVLLTAAMTVLAAPPASAHAELISSDPAEGSSLAALPSAVTLTFSEPVTPGPKVVEIVGPGNATWTTGTPSVAGEVITVPVTATGAAGPVTLTYRVISSDGDPVTGSVGFTLAVDPAPPSSTAAPSPPPASTTPTPTTPPSSAPSSAAAPAQSSSDDEGGGALPTWAWILGALVVAVGGAGLALRGRRSGST